ncbi:energy-coupling factor transporter transmembrane component T family protein [Moritella viscosa]
MSGRIKPHHSSLHQLNGVTKFVLFLAWVTVVLTTFDLRLILALIITGCTLLKLTKVPFPVYKTLLIATASVLTINALFMFLLAPQQGVEYIGSSTILLSLWGDYSLTQEALYYLLTVTLKYFSMFPIALVFVFTTHPTEFAASLNRLGVPYKIAYAVSLTLRYLPDVKNDGFGHNKMRTWYSLKPMTKQDYAVMGLITLVVTLAIIKRVMATELFWYPF